MAENSRDHPKHILITRETSTIAMQSLHDISNKTNVNNINVFITAFRFLSTLSHSDECSGSALKIFTINTLTFTATIMTRRVAYHQAHDLIFLPPIKS